MPPQDPNQQQIPTQVRPLPKAPPEPLTGSPYDFIMSPNTKPPKQGLGLKGGPKLIYIAGGGVLLVVALFLLLSLTSGGSNNPSLVAVAQQQAEIARVAELHYGDIRDDSVKDFVINTQLSATSAKSEYLNYLSSHGAAIDSKQIELGTNSQTDTALDAAQTSGTLDSTVKSTLQTALQRYQQALQQAYNGASAAETKVLIKTFYDQATLLLEQSKS